MTVSIKKHFSHAPAQEQIEFKRVMDAVLADLTSQKVVIDAMVALSTELRTDMGTVATFQAALTAKLDADGGITDVNYASTLTEVVAPSAAAASATALTLIS